MKSLWDRFVLWSVSVSFGLFVGVYLGLIRRRRMSHNSGVAGAGRIKVVQDQSFPPHPFFAPGREFTARVRHASAGFLDDGMLLVRAMAIKFNDAPVDSPLDIELNNGRSLFWTTRNFLEFVKMRRNDRGQCYSEWYEKYPEGRAAAQDSLAFEPSSYHTLEYTSQCPNLWIGSDGVKRYACYRVIPKDLEVESLRNSEEEIGHFDGDQRVKSEGEPKDRNYLKTEYRARVAKGPVQYRLQVQTRQAQENEDLEIFNSNKRWDETEFPWHDLAEITIERTFDYEEGQSMWFSLAHHPPGLGIIPAKSIDDPNSINYMRVKSDTAKRMRMWAEKRRGVQPLIANAGPRNVDEFNTEDLLFPEGATGNADLDKAKDPSSAA